MADEDEQFGKIAKLTPLDLVKTLLRHRKDFDIEMVEPDDSSYMNGFKNVIPPIVCPSCQETKSNSLDLANHIREKHLAEEDVELFSKMDNMLPKYAMEILKKGISNQMAKSYSWRRFENADNALKCSIRSPLARFLAIPLMKIYIDDDFPKPKGKQEETAILLTLHFSYCDEPVRVAFVYNEIERVHKKAQTAALKEEKALKKQKEKNEKDFEKRKKQMKEEREKRKIECRTRKGEAAAPTGAKETEANAAKAPRKKTARAQKPAPEPEGSKKEPVVEAKPKPKSRKRK